MSDVKRVVWDLGTDMEKTLVAGPVFDTGGMPRHEIVGVQSYEVCCCWVVCYKEVKTGRGKGLSHPGPPRA